jgi:hypothetical protein
MSNAIEQKVEVLGALGDLRLTVEQRPDRTKETRPSFVKWLNVPRNLWDPFQ